MSGSRILPLLLISLASLSSTLWADEPVATSDPFQLPKLPPIKLSQGIWYPDRAKAAGLEGRVLAAFDITPAGIAQNISVLWSEDELLASSTIQMLSKAHFNVPADWQTSGAWRRWRVGFVFCLPPSGQPDDFGISVETIYVRGTPVRGAPQRHPPDKGSTSGCNKQP
jgi:TonB family protein